MNVGKGQVVEEGRVLVVLEQVSELVSRTNCRMQRTRRGDGFRA